MDAAHTFHQNQNNSELTTRRKSVMHLIDHQGCDEQRVTCVATRPPILCIHKHHTSAPTFHL